MNDVKDVTVAALTSDELELLETVVLAIAERRRQVVEALDRVEPPDDLFWYTLDAYGRNRFVCPEDIQELLDFGVFTDGRGLWVDVELDTVQPEYSDCILSAIIKFEILRNVRPSILAVSGVEW